MAALDRRDFLRGGAGVLGVTAAAGPAAGVLAAFDRVLAAAPAAFNAVVMARAVPIGRGGPREAIGRRDVRG